MQLSSGLTAGRCDQTESVGLPVVRSGGVFCGAAGWPTARCPAVVRRRNVVGAGHVSARFLPYDDVCRVTPIRKATAAEDGSVEWCTRYGGKGFLFDGRQSYKPSSTATIRLPAHSRPAASHTFLSELQEVLARTVSQDNADINVATIRERDGDEVENVSWSLLFRKWPLELAASGYAEWWLRHPRCAADASQLFRMLIDGVAMDECSRKPFNGAREQSSEHVHGALSCLRALYAVPAQSLKVAFKTPLYHQQLFFRICRRGAHRHVGVKDEQEDGRGLSHCLSLAAAVAQRISGNKLAMRHDLMRFLGRVERDWSLLLQTCSEEEVLRAELERVRALLPFATD